jgi:hypothetical protein
MSDEKFSPKEILESAANHLRSEFEEIKKNNPHAAESGAEAQIILSKFLQDHLPRRFDIESGYVLGPGGSLSRQTDLIIFDALDSPIYRRGPRVQIIPRDCVAAVIEVKSKLNKDELTDAAAKIASVKQIKASPITNVDQPVTFSPILMTNTLGCVFAFDSYTSLKTLAENLREINSKYDSNSWIDLVVVLNQGFIAYMIQFPFGQDVPGWFGGSMTDEFPVPPIYMHLAVCNAGESTLNNFFVKLMSHLTFFRRRSTLDFREVLGGAPKEAMLIQSYQYNLKRRLVPTDASHQKEKFKNPEVRFNIYGKQDRTLKGQVCLLPWQDGAAITCSAMIDPGIVFSHYFKCLGMKGQVLQAGQNVNMWFSSILPILEADFIKCSENIHAELIAVRDPEGDDPPPTKI